MHVRDRSFAADIWSLARRYWVSEERWVARALLALVVGLALGSIYITVLFNHWNAAFYNAPVSPCQEALTAEVRGLRPITTTHRAHHREDWSRGPWARDRRPTP